MHVVWGGVCSVSGTNSTLNLQMRRGETCVTGWRGAGKAAPLEVFVAGVGWRQTVTWLVCARRGGDLRVGLLSYIVTSFS